MNSALTWLLSTASPSPSPTPPPIDPSRVTPGLLGFLSFVFLIVAAFLLYKSMSKQLKKVDPSLPEGPSGQRRRADDQAIEDAERRGDES